MEQSVPNPSNGFATIRYHISGNAKSMIVINDMKGRIVKSVELSNGDGQVVLDNKSLASGAYSYSLFVGGKKVDTKKMIIER